MLDRNRRIKAHPERFQNCYDHFDVVFTLEERVYDQVVEGRCHLSLFLSRLSHTSYNLINYFILYDITELTARTPTDNTPVHVINLDVTDNHEDATIGAFLILDLAQILASSSDLDNDIDELLQDFEAKTDRRLLHTIAFQ